jgi:copper chaperone
MQEELSLLIEGMHCGACVRRVSNTLEKIEGVRIGSVEVGSAKVTFNSKETSVKEITDAVNRIGFAAHEER